MSTYVLSRDSISIAIVCLVYGAWQVSRSGVDAIFPVLIAALVLLAIDFGIRKAFFLADLSECKADTNSGKATFQYKKKYYDTEKYIKLRSIQYKEMKIHKLEAIGNSRFLGELDYQDYGEAERKALQLAIDAYYGN